MIFSFIIKVGDVFMNKHITKEAILNNPPSIKRLYGYSGILNTAFFDTLEELTRYLEEHKETLKKDFGTTYIVDYLGSAFGKEQVILETPQNGAKPLIIAHVDNEGYAIYNKERSLSEKRFIWEYGYESDSIKALYNALKERSIITSNNKTLVRK